jgi:sigma-B regulation protein RsbU (phosphoserine phosphatase)
MLTEDPQAIYDQAPCGYLSTTPDGRIVKVNETFLSWTSYTRDALLGRQFSSTLSAGGRIYHDTHYAPMLRLQGTVREIALDIVTPDGRRLPVLVNATMHRDEKGDPSVIRLVVLDATERREYERELLRAKQRAEDSEARARALAHTLQQTLMPPSLPHISGLDLVAVYRAAGDGTGVGGDFYDVFEIGADDWVVVLGDVCGKGVDAAVVTALVRHTLRAVSVRTSNPAEVLQVLDDVLQHHPAERSCTVALLRLRRDAEGWNACISLGGHPQPLLLRSGSPASSVGETGSLVGAFPEAEFAEADVRLEPGDTLLLFTDGVTEARSGGQLYGDARLIAAAEQHTGSANLVQTLLDDVLTFQSGSPRDDIAMLSLTVGR